MEKILETKRYVISFNKESDKIHIEDKEKSTFTLFPIDTIIELGKKYLQENGK